MFFSEQRERCFSSGDGFSCKATSDDVWAGAGSLLTGTEARRQHESSKSESISRGVFMVFVSNNNKKTMFNLKKLRLWQKMYK